MSLRFKGSPKECNECLMACIKELETKVMDDMIGLIEGCKFNLEPPSNDAEDSWCNFQHA